MAVRAQLPSFTMADNTLGMVGSESPRKSFSLMPSDAYNRADRSQEILSEGTVPIDVEFVLLDKSMIHLSRHETLTRAQHHLRSWLAWWEHEDLDKVEDHVATGPAGKGHSQCSYYVGKSRPIQPIQHSGSDLGIGSPASGLRVESTMLTPWLVGL